MRVSGVGCEYFEDDLDYTICEGYKVLDQLSNQLKEAIEVLATSSQNDQFEYQDLVKFYHAERDRFRNLTDAAKLKLQRPPEAKAC